MIEEGPQLETLTRRLAECPADFMAAPRDRGGVGEVYVPAVVLDVLRELGGMAITAQQRDEFEFKRGDGRKERHLRVVLIAGWLLYDPWFRSRNRFALQAYDFLASGVKDVAAIVPPQAFVGDPDRREELARLCLNALGLRPAKTGSPRSTASNAGASCARPARLKNARGKSAKRWRARPPKKPPPCMAESNYFLPVYNWISLLVLKQSGKT